MIERYQQLVAIAQDHNTLVVAAHILGWMIIVYLAWDWLAGKLFRRRP